MINGHGDDAFRYGRPIVANFSSNVYGHVDLEPLKAHLRETAAEGDFSDMVRMMKLMIDPVEVVVK